MKKLVSMLLAIAMLATLMGGFSAIAESPVKIQVILPANVQDFPEGITEDNNFIVDYWREKTGYDFDCIILGTEDAATQLNTMLNGGDCNGIIVTRGAANVGKFAAEGLILSLENYKDKATLYTRNDCSAGIYNGEQFAFCQSDSVNYNTDTMWYINKDIAEELGYDHSPATYDEFLEFLYKAKDAGYLPLALRGSAKGSPAVGNGDSLYPLLQGLYGLGGGEYAVNENNEIYYKYITEQAKEYLLFMKKLYDDGLIPADFASQTQEGVAELLLSKKAASGLGISVWNTSVLTQADEMGINLRVPDYPTDINGNQAYGSVGVGYGATSLIFMIAEGCEHVDECIEVMNLWCTDEAITLANYGIEGVNYTVDDNGKIQTIEGSDSVAWGVYYRNVYKPDYWYDVYGINADWNEFYYPAERPIVGCPTFDPIVHMPVNSDNVQKLDELRNNIVSPFYTRVVMGEESIDNWDAMVEQWKSQGGAELMEYYTNEYNAMGRPTFTYWTQLPDEHPEYVGKYLYDGAEAAATQRTVSDNGK